MGGESWLDIMKKAFLTKDMYTSKAIKPRRSGEESYDGRLHKKHQKMISSRRRWIFKKPSLDHKTITIIHHHHHVAMADEEKKAAVRIQTSFRGYLARRAVEALRGVVRLQALIRGHNVRKMTLKCMQALLRIQAQICQQRMNHQLNYRSVEEIQAMLHKTQISRADQIEDWDRRKRYLNQIINVDTCQRCSLSPKWDYKQENQFQSPTHNYRVRAESPTTPSRIKTSIKVKVGPGEERTWSTVETPTPSYMSTTASARQRIQGGEKKKKKTSARKRLSFDACGNGNGSDSELERRSSSYCKNRFQSLTQQRS